MSQANIAEVTQSLIAILIVGIAGFAVLSGNVHAPEALALLGGVMGYYFGRFVPSPSTGTDTKS